MPRSPDFSGLRSGRRMLGLFFHVVGSPARPLLPCSGHTGPSNAGFTCRAIAPPDSAFAFQRVRGQPRDRRDLAFYVWVVGPALRRIGGPSERDTGRRTQTDVDKRFTWNETEEHGNWRAGCLLERIGRCSTLNITAEPASSSAVTPAPTANISICWLESFFDQRDKELR